MTIPALIVLEHQVARDLEMLGRPPVNWPAGIVGPDDKTMLDVLVVGASVFGLAAAASLLFKGIRNIAVLDRAPHGREGIWTTTARMAQLRSPKGVPGLAFGIPSLTFRAWYTACRGEAAWAALGKAPNQDWQDYLTWIRRALSIPVQNDVAIEDILPSASCLEVETTKGRLFARRVVLATGRSRSDTALVPDGIAPALWPDRAAHSAEPIDFAKLVGKRVAVVGGAASAWDNAATALEKGAARVDMYVRRAALPQVNPFVPFLAAGGPAFFEGWAGLPASDRWDLMVYLLRDSPAPPPPESVLRAVVHPNLAVHLDSAILSAEPLDDGVTLRIGGGSSRTEEADFLILATGFDMDLGRARELRRIAPHVASWADMYTPPPDRAWPLGGRFPWLGEGFELVERTPEACPEAARVHLFNHSAFASLGAIGNEIHAVSAGADRLASRIAAAFAQDDLAHLRSMLTGYRQPALINTPFHVPSSGSP